MTNPFSANPLTPWHMWGGTVTFRLNSTGVPIDQKLSTQQLAKVSYRRPDTWAFFMGGRIVSGPPAVADYFVQLNIDIIPGVGRTIFDTFIPAADSQPGFAEFLWLVAAGNSPRPSNRKYTSCVQSPAMRDGDDTSVMLIDRIPAQDLQLQATLQVDSFPLNSELIFEATALLAPLSHIRPDWFSEGEQFRGDETGGT